jgi:hypothetical protein
VCVCLYICRSQWPRGLRRRSTAARLLRSWVRNPPGAWMFVCCVCCVLSGRGLCDELISRPEESYRLWRVVVCDHETSWYEEATARAELQTQRNKQTCLYVIVYVTLYACMYVYVCKHVCVCVCVCMFVCMYISMCARMYEA